MESLELTVCSKSLQDAIAAIAKERWQENGIPTTVEDENSEMMKICQELNVRNPMAFDPAYTGDLAILTLLDIQQGDQEVELSDIGLKAQLEDNNTQDWTEILNSKEEKAAPGTSSKAWSKEKGERKIIPFPADNEDSETDKETGLDEEP